MTRFEQLDNIAKKFFDLAKISNEDMKVIWLEKYYQTLKIIENSTVYELSQTVN